MKPKIYIAGPISLGDWGNNVHKALEAAEHIVRIGGVPFVPHLSLLWQVYHPHDHTWWLEQDLVWLDSCDALYRIRGESDGADREVGHALAMPIPVFLGEPIGLGQLLEWIRERNRDGNETS